MVAQGLDPGTKLPMLEPCSDTLGKLLSLSVPQFPPLSNGSNPTGLLYLSAIPKSKKHFEKQKYHLRLIWWQNGTGMEMSLLMAMVYPL